MDDRIIVVDDDRDYLEILWYRLSRAGYKNIRVEERPDAAAALFESGDHFDIALIDLNMGKMDGLALLEVIRGNSPNTACIIVTALNEAKTAVECIRKGAYDYLVKPVSQDDLLLAVSHALERKHLLDLLNIDKQRSLPRLNNREPFRNIVTRSRNVLKVLKEAELHARSNVPILITGESGTGKELLARAVHLASRRADRPMTTVNMAAITPGLFDAEFFGHTRGAFTGADRDRIGYLEYTNGGTLFLDEIGITPPELQGRLLRVLQSGEYMKLGTNTPQMADVRIIAATNEDMEQLIAQKKFRKDFYYRLRGGWLHLPPLRERRADIPLLVNLFLEEFCGKSEKCSIGIRSMALLMRYNYPGNVRELKSIISAALNLAQGGPVTVECLPEHLRQTNVVIPEPECVETGDSILLADVEKAHILKIYKKFKQNKSRTARMLGIGLNTLRRKLAAYGVE